MTSSQDLFAPEAAAPSLRAQADAVDLQRLGLRDLIQRAEDRLLKRPPEWLESKRERLVTLEAAAETLRVLALKENRGAQP